MYLISRILLSCQLPRDSLWDYIQGLFASFLYEKSCLYEIQKNQMIFLLFFFTIYYKAEVEFSYITEMKEKEKNIPFLSLEFLFSLIVYLE